ncbi:MAG: hypothetical protein JO080_07760 [Mucilaginibacter sp.]|nr:hypothetical protein [Mucilaginibacter sp.]
MIKKIYLIVFVSLITISASFGQQKKNTADTIRLKSNSNTTSFDIHFNGFVFLDDHEYDALIPIRKTISGTRTALDVGFNADSLNHFVVGVNGLHEFGGKPYFLKVDPVAYYNFTNKHWIFNAGDFPRQGLLTQYPRALLNDTLIYYRPNVEGLLLSNHGKHGNETLWIDWLSRQTATDRNQFLAGFFGKFKPWSTGPLYISHFFMFMHDAGTKPLQPNSPIEDNGGAQVRLGLDLTHKQTLFDSLSFEVGGMGSAHRVRSQFNFIYSRGVVASFYASYKAFSLYDEFYKGEPNYIIYGDPFYVKTIYNRLDVSYAAFVYKHLRGSFMFSFHQSPSRLTDLSEVFRLVYDIGRVKIAQFNSN